MVLIFETAHRRYDEHAKCSCVPEGAVHGPPGPRAERRQRISGRAIKVRCDRAVLWAGSLAAVLTSFPGRWTSLTSWIH
jgi:hypothetical protein